jgi:hypothetical protein
MAERPAGFGYAPHPDLATPRPADAQASTAQARGLVKVSMNFTPQTIDVLRKLADHQNRTMTEVVRRAIGLLDFIEKETKAGGKLLIEDAGGKLKRVIMP